ncbi:MAG: hypothetical protein ACKV2T_34280 [Kofleriaceae bacterium]
MARETKKSVPPRTRTRTTRRGLAQHADTQPPEPATSTRPTRRDLSVIEPATSARPTRRDLAGAVDSHVDALQPAPNARGQFSISSARGVPADVVSGSIEVGDRKRRRTIDIVHLVSASKREVTVIVNEQVLTLKRDEALALARIITTAFE